VGDSAGLAREVSLKHWVELGSHSLKKIAIWVRLRNVPTCLVKPFKFFATIAQRQKFASPESTHMDAVRENIAFADKLTRQKVLDAGFDRHVAKPIDPFALADVVIDLLTDSHPQGDSHRSICPT
jgi:hypothetical protein